MLRGQGGAKVIQDRVGSLWAEAWRKQSFSSPPDWGLDPSGSQRQLGKDGQRVSSSPTSLRRGAGRNSLLPEQPQKMFWFVTHLASLSHNKLLRGEGGTASTPPQPAGSKNVREPHVTLPCLRELIPQASQRYFGEGGAVISCITPCW